MAVDKGDATNDLEVRYISNPSNEDLKESMSSLDTVRIQRVDERMEFLEKMMQRDENASRF